MALISILTPVYNGETTIHDCLKSIDYQSFQDIEHIIIDGASTDSTLAVVERFANRCRQVISERDRGIYDAMNKGLKIAKGEIVGILNADDIYADDRVLQDVCSVFADSGVDCCYGDLKYVDCNDPDKTVRLWRSGRFKPEKFRWGWMPPHPTFFVRRALYEKYGGFNERLGTAADYELMLRFLLRHRLGAAYVPRVLVKMRTCGASNVTLARRLAANRMDRKAWEINGLRPWPWTLLCKPLRKVGQWIMKSSDER